MLWSVVVAEGENEPEIHRRRRVVGRRRAIEARRIVGRRLHVIAGRRRRVVAGRAELQGEEAVVVVVVVMVPVVGRRRAGDGREGHQRRERQADTGEAAGGQEGFHDLSPAVRRAGLRAFRWSGYGRRHRRSACRPSHRAWNLRGYSPRWASALRRGALEIWITPPKG